MERTSEGRFCEVRGGRIRNDKRRGKANWRRRYGGTGVGGSLGGAGIIIGGHELRELEQVGYRPELARI